MDPDLRVASRRWRVCVPLHATCSLMAYIRQSSEAGSWYWHDPKQTRWQSSDYRACNLELMFVPPPDFLTRHCPQY